MRRICLAALFGFAFLPGVGCSSSYQPGPAAKPMATNPPAGGDCTSDFDRSGCGCDREGATRPCFVNSAGASCIGGTQSCTRLGEFLSWTSCQGAPVDCSNPCAAGEFVSCVDGSAATPDLLPSPPPPPTVDMQPVCTNQCEPGAYRWCDEPTYCNWGRQQCDQNGMWGACIETTMVPNGCSGPAYDEQCCVNAGECCQDFTGNPTGSVGNCSAIVCNYNGDGGLPTPHP